MPWGKKRRVASIGTALRNSRTTEWKDPLSPKQVALNRGYLLHTTSSSLWLNLQGSDTDHMLFGGEQLALSMQVAKYCMLTCQVGSPCTSDRAAKLNWEGELSFPALEALILDENPVHPIGWGSLCIRQIRAGFPPQSQSRWIWCQGRGKTAAANCVVPPTHLFSLVKVLQASGETSAFHGKSPRSATNPRLTPRCPVTCVSQHSSFPNTLKLTFCIYFCCPYLHLGRSRHTWKRAANLGQV